MSGGAKFEYLWQDGVKYKKPVHLPAPQYIALLMDWVKTQINDEALFPVTTDIRFPKKRIWIRQNGLDLSIHSKSLV